MKTIDGRLPGGSTDPLNQVIFWGGSAVLSSSVLAAAIKAYVALKKRKVVVTIGADKKLEYEGSDLEGDREAIEAMIDKLTDEGDLQSVTIYAERRH
jgi:biopolymer transport protein ExbD